MEKPHLLILDEPTNHLDIDSRRALTEALNDYAGAVILITHDRSLMELVADRLWVAAEGTVKPFDGDVDDYARQVLDRARQAARGAGKAAPPSPPAPAVRPALGPLKRKVEAAEEVLNRDIKILAELDERLSYHQLSPDELAEMGRRRARAAERLAVSEAKWVEVAEQYEAAKA
jgi:ATP-binding cassette subfamily F protein 3